MADDIHSAVAARLAASRRRHRPSHNTSQQLLAMASAARVSVFLTSALAAERVYLISNWIRNGVFISHTCNTNTKLPHRFAKAVGLVVRTFCRNMFLKRRRRWISARHNCSVHVFACVVKPILCIAPSHRGSRPSTHWTHRVRVSV